jgi:multiple sugar transport system substrate-binding protein
VPVQGDADAEAKAATIAECLTSPKTVFDTDKALTYVSAVPSVQERQISAAPDFAVWVDAVNAAKGRTSDGLGTRYPRISEQLWKAVQVALTGSKSPGEALSDAQAAAQKAK